MTRRWLVVSAAGVAIVTLVLVTVVLVLVDKEHFGGLVGSMFLQTITVSMLVGALLVLIGAWNLRRERTWRWLVLAIWALVALVSPAFGIMFLIPWGALAVLLPVVVAALIGISRRTAPVA